MGAALGAAHLGPAGHGDPQGDKPALRRLLWAGDDVVLERVEGRYVPFTAARLEKLLAEYAEHGRAGLVS